MPALRRRRRPGSRRSGATATRSAKASRSASTPARCRAVAVAARLGEEPAGRRRGDVEAEHERLHGPQSLLRGADGSARRRRPAPSASTRDAGRRVGGLVTDRLDAEQRGAGIDLHVARRRRRRGPARRSGAGMAISIFIASTTPRRSPASTTSSGLPRRRRRPARRPARARCRRRRGRSGGRRRRPRRGGRSPCTDESPGRCARRSISRRATPTEPLDVDDGELAPSSSTSTRDRPVRRSWAR